MIDERIEVFTRRITALPWVERYSPLAIPVKINISATDQKVITAIYPVSRKVDGQSCLSGNYYDLVPDSSKKSVVYWMQTGDVDVTAVRWNDYTNDMFFRYSASVKLVAWINLKLLGAGCTFDPTLPVRELIRAIALSGSDFTVNSIVTDPKRIFSGLSYENMQELYLFPYYAVAIEGVFAFDAGSDCIDEWVTLPVDNCICI